MNFKKITALLLACLMLWTNVCAADVNIDIGGIFGDGASQESGENAAQETVTQTPDVVPETDASQEETESAADGESQESGTQAETDKKIYFSDVPADSSYAEAVEKLVLSGIINGYADNTFRPENGITRAEMCKMINLTFNYIDYDKAEGFPDVSPEDWFSPYVLAAQQAGYIEGYEDGSFRPNNNITRQEVCVIINRILKPMDLGLNVTITDEVSDWAKEAVTLVVMNMMMPLEENNTFRAKENIKRYELASLLSRFVVQPVEPLTAEVRFFHNGVQIGETDKVFIGDYPTVPEAPAHPDQAYEFAGWREVGATELTDPYNYMILGNIDYETVYTKKTFKVEFYDGGTLFDTVIVEYGESPLTPPSNPVTDGYIFLGWSYQDGGETVDVSELVITSDTELYAVFKIKENGGGGETGGGGDDSGDEGDYDETTYYDVYFYVNEEIYNTQKVLGGSCAKKPVDPDGDDVFLGWSLKETGDAGDVIDVTSYRIRTYTDFYAIFKVNPNDPELIPMLERGIAQLDDIALSNNKHKTARSEMVACMQLVLNDAKAGIYVDQEYVNSVYGTQVDYVESLVLDEMTGREASEFKNLLVNNVDKDVKEFLQEYFLNGEDIEV